MSKDLVESPVMLAAPANHQFSMGATSPNGSWFTYLEVLPDADSFELWISSTDGRTQSRVAQLARGEWARWVSDETIVILDLIGGDPGAVSVARLQPFTGEVTSLEEVYYYLSVMGFSPDLSKTIYLAPVGQQRWTLYTFATGMAEAIFPWLDAELTEISGQAFVNWSQGGVAVGVLEADRLTLATNLSERQLTERVVPAQVLLMPAEATWWRIVWWSADSRRILVLQAYGKPEEGPWAGPDSMYLLDTEQSLTYDYCLSESPGSVFASVDDRFIAWRSFNSTTGAGTVVLELATGQRAWLPGVEVIGWVELAPTAMP